MAVVVPVDECAICLDESELEWKKLTCEHLFHKDCVDRWLMENDTCPICRSRQEHPISTRTRRCSRVCCYFFWQYGCVQVLTLLLMIILCVFIFSQVR